MPHRLDSALPKVKGFSGNATMRSDHTHNILSLSLSAATYLLYYLHYISCEKNKRGAAAGGTLECGDGLSTVHRSPIEVDARRKEASPNNILANETDSHPFTSPLFSPGDSSNDSFPPPYSSLSLFSVATCVTNTLQVPNDSHILGDYYVT